MSTSAPRPQQDPEDRPVAVHELPVREVKVPLNYKRIILLYVLPALLTVGTLAFFILGSPYVKTENAYTKSEILAVSAQVSAPITEMFVRENQTVQEGDLLFRLDAEPFAIRLLEKQASLETNRRNIETLKAGYRERLFALEVAKSDVAFAEREFRRQSELASTKVVSEARFDRARHTVDAARQEVTILNHDLQRLLVSLAGNPDLPVNEHPDVIEAQAQVTKAELDLARTSVTATISGFASNVPNRGDYVRSGFPVMSIVSAEDIRVEANFKETQLTFVEPGQPVTIKIDAYPGWEWEGYVESIASATGAEFSILPAQNSSGNWVKVVQRVPVRIHIEPIGDEPLLRTGLSAHVSIDTGVRRGAFAARKEARDILPPLTSDDNFRN